MNKLLRFIFKAEKVDTSEMGDVKGKHYYVKRWPFPDYTAAITLGSVVLHRDKDPKPDLIEHEEVHVASNHGKTEIGKKQKNMLRWYLSYLWEIKKKGYRDNKYEREARK